MEMLSLGRLCAPVVVDHLNDQLHLALNNSTPEICKRKSTYPDATSTRARHRGFWRGARRSFGRLTLSFLSIVPPFDVAPTPLPAPPDGAGTAMTTGADCFLGRELATRGR
jgi:hypothetical protein